ncbi:hypothetical protein B4064_3655 [Caldibacillus thermoamylovorans]|uniref:hypothetical protein n=1 Tax=Bacillaceae TaxID=186817 RepID=UPI0005A48B38|nr:hypothetical protein [Caldibacillus thermoamylovorans]KIO60316.1 hypothetical protein B4064_3655 [Caldibacillus thermoamylovorans]
MVKTIYEQLKTPKSVEELHQRLKESGVKWNKAQLQLFLLMDSNIKKTGDLYSAGGNNLNTIILDIVDKVMDGKPVAPIKRIMEYVPSDITVSAEEISKIAEQSGKYKLHSNGAVLMRAKN